uniref:Reverse transcriptase domain-containing protein n=1 Tax=Amphimedon queenslandica TaxID=400682 RepID=A0A1X7TEE0_AMPQE
MPRIEELLNKVGDAKFISTMDLAKGYWQVPLNNEDKEKTAFSTPNRLFQFITMPFGLSGAPATFQRMMDNVLRGTDDYAGVYLDDIVIYSTNWKTHLEHLEKIFQRLKEANLTIKTAVCVFGTEDCIYLGYKIGKGGDRPEDSKVQAINSSDGDS